MTDYEWFERTLTDRYNVEDEYVKLGADDQSRAERLATLRSCFRRFERNYFKVTMYNYVMFEHWLHVSKMNNIDGYLEYVRYHQTHSSKDTISEELLKMIHNLEV